MQIQETVLSDLKDVLAKELTERKINPVMIPIINGHLEGTSIDTIAEENGLNVMEVSLILDRSEVQSYITHALQSYGYLNRKKRADLIGTVIAKKLAMAEEYELEDISKKDLFDWLKLALEEEKALKGAAPQIQITNNTQVNNNMVDLLNEVLETK